GDTDSGDDGDAGGDLSGTLIGAGASSQAAAMQGWQAGFQNLNADVTVEYDPIGSGGGRDTFIEGGSDFAGSDSLLDDEEYEASVDRCEGDQGAIHLPHYISPVVVAYNLPGVDSLNLSPETVAGIFAAEITNWTDEAIVADNPDADLPDLAVNAVHRSDESGTTENFTDYLATVAPDIWTYGLVGEWPIDSGEGAPQTSGVVAAISAGEGSIGYSDASQVPDDLGVADIGVGGEFVEYSPDAASRLVEVSEQIEGRSEYDLGFNLTRDTEESGVWPIALVSYHIVCLEYPDQDTVDLVKAFMTYVASEEGQQASAESAGSAPIGDGLRERVMDSIDQVIVAG
ncbi:MAG: phosphate ABC transporter substrate-binding protein PstS, partial [Acidimicrobiales bacterium]